MGFHHPIQVLEFVHLDRGVHVHRIAVAQQNLRFGSAGAASRGAHRRILRRHAHLARAFVGRNCCTRFRWNSVAPEEFVAAANPWIAARELGIVKVAVGGHPDFELEAGVE